MQEVERVTAEEAKAGGGEKFGLEGSKACDAKWSMRRPNQSCSHPWFWRKQVKDEIDPGANFVSEAMAVGQKLVAWRHAVTGKESRPTS